MENKVAKSPDDLLKWIKDLNPGLHTEHWRVLDRLAEPKGQGLILLIDRDSFKVIKETGYKIFTGLTQATVRVLSDLKQGPNMKKGSQ
jgi:DNA integrity scanning protein DisA with diadenylate cyclase activity